MLNFQVLGHHYLDTCFPYCLFHRVKYPSLKGIVVCVAGVSFLGKRREISTTAFYLFDPACAVVQYRCTQMCNILT